MKKASVLLVLLVLSFACTADQSGTGDQENTNAEPTPMPTATESNANAESTPTPEEANEEKKEKGHVHKAPRGGTLIGFGEEFAHIEIVLDQKTGKITAYVLDGEAEKSVQIEQSEIEIEVEKPKKLTLKLTAVESLLTGEKVGKTSEFSAQSDELKGLKKFEAKIKEITVKGKKFTGEGFNFPEGNEHQHEG